MIPDQDQLLDQAEQAEIAQKGAEIAFWEALYAPEYDIAQTTPSRRHQIMSDTITPPVGAETYTDAMGREQWRVIGRTGARFLITRKDNLAEWRVWHPDSLRTAHYSRNLQRALDWAAARLEVLAQLDEEAGK